MRTAGMGRARGLRAGLAWAVIIAAVLAGCGKQQSQSGVGAGLGDGDIPPAAPPPAPPKPPVLTQVSPLVWRYAPPGNDRGTTTLLIDNGLSEDVTLTVSASDSIVVPGGKLGRLWLTPGPGTVKYAIGGEAAQTIPFTGVEGNLYVLNPGAAWDYSFERQEYSTLSVSLSSGLNTTPLNGRIFFETGRVDYLFEAFPETVEVTTYSGFGATSKTRLTHTNEAARRNTQTVAVGEQTYFVTQLGEDRYAICTAASGSEMPARVYLDLSNGKAEVQLRGTALFTVEGCVAELELAPGDWELTAVGIADAALPTLKGSLTGGRYLWSPGGGERYRIDFKQYGSSMFGRDTTPSAESFRGLTFVPIPTRLAFESFPYSVQGNVFASTVLVDRFMRDSGESTEAVKAALKAEYETALAAAREAAGGRAGELEAALQEMAGPVSDLQLAYVQGLQYEFTAATAAADAAEGDWEAAAGCYGIAGRFKSRWPLLHQHRGQVYMQLKSWSEAQEAFQQAIELQPALEAKLKKPLEICAQELEKIRQAEEAEAAKDAAEEAKEKDGAAAE